MAFKPLTEDKESLQALAFAVRQNKGDNITPEDVLAAMDLSVLDYNVKNYCDIDYTKLTSRFENWKNIGKPEELEEWVNSSVWTANAVVKSQYLTGGGYVFSNNIGDPIFRGAYREIAKDIAQNAKDSVVKRVYKTLAGGTGDKWNPADVIAVKKSKWSSLVKQMEGFKNGKPDLTMIINGILAGLVSVTAGCGNLTMAGAWLAGLVGGGIVVYSVAALDSLRIDDPVGAFSVHGVCGIWGTVVVGLWGYDIQGTGAGLGLFTGGGFDQLFIQIVGCIAYAVWTVITCYIAWKVIGAAFGGIRVTEEQEKIGLDITEHGIEAYPDYAMSGSGVSNR